MDLKSLKRTLKIHLYDERKELNKATFRMNREERMHYVQSIDFNYIHWTISLSILMEPRLKLIDLPRASPTKKFKPIFKTHIPRQSRKNELFYRSVIWIPRAMSIVFSTWWVTILDINIVTKKKDELSNKYTSKTNECWKLKSNISSFNPCQHLFCLFMHDYILDSILLESDVSEVLTSGIWEEMQSFVKRELLSSTLSLSQTFLWIARRFQVDIEKIC